MTAKRLGNPQAETFAARLTKTRREAGLSTEELAARAGLARAAVYKIEAGADAKVSSVRKLAKALGVSVSDLIE